MVMADCRTCHTRITSLRDTWVHLAVLDDNDVHAPEPPLSHRWHRNQQTTPGTWYGHIPDETWSETPLFNPGNRHQRGWWMGGRVMTARMIPLDCSLTRCHSGPVANGRRPGGRCGRRPGSGAGCCCSLNCRMRFGLG